MHLILVFWANLQASLPLDMRASVGPLLFLSFSHTRGVCRNFFSNYQVHFDFSRGWKYGSISGISYQSFPGTRFASMVFEWAHIPDTRHWWKKVSPESGYRYGFREDLGRADSSGVQESKILYVAESLFTGGESPLSRVFYH